MKFGEELLRLRITAWKQHYLRYGLLKFLILTYGMISGQNEGKVCPTHSADSLPPSPSSGTLDDPPRAAPQCTLSPEGLQALAARGPTVRLNALVLDTFKLGDGSFGGSRGTSVELKTTNKDATTGDGASKQGDTQTPDEEEGKLTRQQSGEARQELHVHFRERSEVTQKALALVTYLKSLHRHVARCPCSVLASFRAVLCQDLASVEHFYLRTLNFYRSQLCSVESAMMHIRTEARSSGGVHDDQSAQTRLHHLSSVAHNVYHDLVLLQSFAVVNLEGVRKIVKKWRKYIGRPCPEPAQNESPSQYSTASSLAPAIMEVKGSYGSSDGGGEGEGGGSGDESDQLPSLHACTHLSCTQAMESFSRSSTRELKVYRYEGVLEEALRKCRRVKADLVKVLARSRAF